MYTFLAVTFAILFYAIMDALANRYARGNPDAENFLCRWGYHRSTFHDTEPFGSYVCQDCKHIEEVNPYLGV